MLFGLFLVIALSAGLVFNPSALPKIVDEGMAKDVPLVRSAASLPPC